MTLFEEQFIYFPESELEQTPADAGLYFETHHFKTSDGVMLHGWYLPYPTSRFTVLHMHGNAGNISHRLPLYWRWHQLGLSVFAFDYRGYGHSAGKATEEGLYKDAKAAWRLMIDGLGLTSDNIIISGRSLGAAVAAKLATERHPVGLVLETPFSNISDMAAYHYPFLPLRWLTRSEFDLKKMVVSVDVPLLLISAKEDAIAPLFMVLRVYDAANNPKRHIRLSGKHNNFDMVSGQQYFESWRSWLNSLPGEGAPD